MNNHNSRKIKRIILAAVMLVIVGYTANFIKDTIDAKNPEDSLPIVSVTTGYTSIPDPPRAGYEWKIGGKTTRSPFVPLIDVPMKTYDALPNTPILINFSLQPEQYALYEGVGRSAEELVEKRYNMQTPSEDGLYVYKIVAQFSKGTIVHCFLLDVKTPHTIL